MAMNGNEGGSAYPPNPDVKSGSCLIAGFQPLTVVHPTYWNAYKTESGATLSVDMVRLSLTFKGDRGEWLSRKGAQLTDCDEMSAWTSKIRPGGWYELWSFALGGSSVALGIAHIADALDRQNPRLALGARDSGEELRQLKVSHLGALAFPRPAQHGYVPLHG